MALCSSHTNIPQFYMRLESSSSAEQSCLNARANDNDLQLAQAPHLLRGTRATCNLRLPSCHFWRGGIVSLECSSSAGQVLHPMLYESDHGEIGAPGTDRMLLRTDFHAGERFCITGSSAGASFRMCDSQACHSGGTCEAWYSCCAKSQTC